MRYGRTPRNLEMTVCICRCLRMSVTAPDSVQYSLMVTALCQEKLYTNKEKDKGTQVLDFQEDRCSSPRPLTVAISILNLPTVF